MQMKLAFGVGEVKCGRCGRIVKFKVTNQSLDRFVEKLRLRDEIVKQD